MRMEMKRKFPSRKSSRRAVAHQAGRAISRGCGDRQRHHRRRRIQSHRRGRARGKAIGDTALAGTINLWGVVEVIVTKPAAESSLQKIITLIKAGAAAEGAVAAVRRQVQHFLHLRCPRTVAHDVFCLAVWDGITPRSLPRPKFTARFYRTMTLLVVPRLVRWCCPFRQRCWRRSPGARGTAFYFVAVPP